MKKNALLCLMPLSLSFVTALQALDSNSGSTFLWQNSGTEEKRSTAVDSKQQEPSAEEYERSPRSMRVGVRHIENKGIGYPTGYTTVEAFFAPRPDLWAVMPFLDLRGHVFNNGQLAANAGLGLRYLTCSRVYGFNAYYDYRKTHKQHYNQVSAGLETLGRVWDFRINGYLPVGAKQSRFYHVEFDGLEGNSMYLSAKREYAFKGANAEIGLHVDSYRPIPLYFATGPYYLNGKGATTWGGQFRARADFFHGMLRLEANTSYDHFFRWIGQGQVGLNFAFGGRVKKKRTCPTKGSLYTRSMQGVDRNEIIPVSKQRVREKATGPGGDPYFFVFVDNTSSSLGTFESPYASLATAQANSSPGDIIYVFPGNGTATNMDTGITLQDSQMLLGAASSYRMPTQLGTVSLPSYASVQPVITNTASAPVITLANNNTVSGMYVANNTDRGIFGSGITNFTATKNTILGGAVAEGILLENPTGLVTLNNNLLVQTGPGSHPNSAFHLQSSEGTCNLSFDGNAFFSQPNGNNTIGMRFELTGTANVNSINVTNTTFACTQTNGPAMTTELSDNAHVGGVFVDNCVVSNFGTGIEFDLFGSSSVDMASLTNIDMSGQGYAGFYIDIENSSSMGTIAVSNASVRNALTYGLVTYQGATATLKSLSVTDSFFNCCTFGVNSELGGSGSLSNFNVANCEFTENVFAVEVDFFSTGSLGNCSVTGCKFTDNPGAGVYLNFNSGESIDKVNLANNTYTGSEYAILSSLTGVVGTMNVSNSLFLNNQYGLSLQHASNTHFTVSNNNFSANQNAINSNAIPATENGVISNNQFIGSSTTNLVLPMLTGTTNSFSVTGNSFTNITGTAIQGYGAQISTTAGSSLCLDFAGNVATPSQSGSFVPYTFDGSSGTFNVTPNTTQANNTGVITSIGTLGSCSGS